jgi:hypothetical protein
VFSQISMAPHKLLYDSTNHVMDQCSVDGPAFGSSEISALCIYHHVRFISVLAYTTVARAPGPRMRGLGEGVPTSARANWTILSHVAKHTLARTQAQKRGRHIYIYQSIYLELRKGGHSFGCQDLGFLIFDPQRVVPCGVEALRFRESIESIFQSDDFVHTIVPLLPMPDTSQQTNPIGHHLSSQGIFSQT